MKGGREAGIDRSLGIELARCGDLSPGSWWKGMQAQCTFSEMGIETGQPSEASRPGSQTHEEANERPWQARSHT